MHGNIITGIDPAGVEKNPTGWALWKNKGISTCHLYENQEILEHSTRFEPTLIAIDAPLSLPKKRTMRTPHEIDVVTAALTGYLYKVKTELIGNDEGYIVIPTKGDWRRLRL